MPDAFGCLRFERDRTQAHDISTICANRMSSQPGEAPEYVMTENPRSLAAALAADCFPTVRLDHGHAPSGQTRSIAIEQPLVGMWHEAYPYA